MASKEQAKAVAIRESIAAITALEAVARHIQYYAGDEGGHADRFDELAKETDEARRAAGLVWGSGQF